MHIIVNRIVSDRNATLSEVYIDGVRECRGLEDEYRQHKVAGETRIPAGIYKLGIRNVGGFHNRYKAKFPNFHKGMLEVKDVPGFDYILIHIGNTEHDTAGCLLVGSTSVISDGTPTINSSTVAYEELYEKVIDAALAGDCTIEYRDSDVLVGG